MNGKKVRRRSLRCRRKNIGYLYAIQGGARIIYETDDDNHLYQDIPVLPASLRMNEYVPVDSPNSTASAINIYATFGLERLWPRGFPLEDIKKAVPRCFQQKLVKPWIQQGRLFLLCRQVNCFNVPTKVACLSDPTR